MLSTRFRRRSGLLCAASSPSSLLMTASAVEEVRRLFGVACSSMLKFGLGRMVGRKDDLVSESFLNFILIVVAMPSLNSVASPSVWSFTTTFLGSDDSRILSLIFFGDVDTGASTLSKTGTSVWRGGEVV